MVLESRYIVHIHTSPMLVSMPEHCEDNGSYDEVKDVESTEEADEESDTEFAGAALEN